MFRSKLLVTIHMYYKVVPLQECASHKGDSAKHPAMPACANKPPVASQSDMAYTATTFRICSVYAVSATRRGERHHRAKSWRLMGTTLLWQESNANLRYRTHALCCCSATRIHTVHTPVVCLKRTVVLLKCFPDLHMLYRLKT